MEVPVFPKWIQLETLNKCNLRCTMCPISTGESKRPNMPFELYEKAIRECADYKDYLETVGLYLLNEPLLDRTLPEKIALAKSLGIKNVHIATNAELLTEDKINALVNAGIDKIILSIESLSSAIQEGIRRGSHLDRIKSNVDKLLRIKRERQLQGLHIQVRMLAFPQNQPEWESYSHYWIEKGASSVHLQPVHNWGGSFADINREEVGMNICNYLWSTLVIQSDGNACLCCLDFAGEFKLGNIKSESIYDIWHGKKFEDVRQQFQQKLLKKCTQCNFTPGKYISVKKAPAPNRDQAKVST